MPVFIDYRERALIVLDPMAKIITPPVGDLWIGDLSGTNLLRGGVILERKTISDFEASFLDGRYHEQRGRLLAYANEHKVAIGYVIEGQIKGRSGRLSDAALEKFIIRLQFHHRIPVLKTSSVEDTLRLAQLIDEQWVHDEGKLAWDTEKSSSQTPVSLSYVKSECRDTPDTFYIGTLTQCRGISESLAKVIVGRYASLEELLKATSGDLALVTDPQNPKRKVGKAVAERLFALLHNIVVEVTEKKIVKERISKKPTRIQECLIQDE